MKKMMLSSNTQIPRIMQALNLILQEEAVLNRREEELQKKWKNINKKEDEFLKYVETIDREFANTLRINNILDISARKRKLQMLDQFLAL